MKLGLVAERSKLGSLAASEFVLSSEWLQQHYNFVDQNPDVLKVVNFTLDEARVCQQQVSNLLICKCYVGVHDWFYFSFQRGTRIQPNVLKNQKDVPHSQLLIVKLFL